MSLPHVNNFDGHQTQVNSPEGVINYSYELATGRHILTRTTNSEIAYRHDELGRLWTISVNKRNGTNLLSPEVITNTYTKVGNLSTATRPNGVLSTYLYDTLNRLTNLTHMATNTLIASYSYQLHATGRRTNAVEILKTEDTGTPYITNTLSWAYDQMYRLTNEVSISTAPSGYGTYTNQFVYDLVGNRFSNTKSYTNTVALTTNQFDINDELLKEVRFSGGVPVETNLYAYDDNGSLIAKTNISSSSSTTLYTYDLKNKLSSVSTTGSSITNFFVYNHQGIRVRTTTTGGSSGFYLIDANNGTGYQQILEEFSTLGALPTRSYVIGDEVVAQMGSVTTYFLKDGHGSNRLFSQADGSVSARFNYEAYGTTLASSSYSAKDAVENQVASMLYCGEQFDEKLEMYNLRARYYEPVSGRFASRDRHSGSNYDPTSLHKYVYAGCDPGNASDPTGDYTLLELIIVVAIIVIGVVAVAETVGSIMNAFRGNKPNTTTEQPAIDAAIGVLKKGKAKFRPPVARYVDTAVNARYRMQPGLVTRLSAYATSLPYENLFADVVQLDPGFVNLTPEFGAATIIHEAVHVHQWTWKESRVEPPAYQVESDMLQSLGITGNADALKARYPGSDNHDFIDDAALNYKDYHVKNPAITK